MKIIEPKVEPVYMPHRAVLYALVEIAGRTCYQSERVERDTAEAFIKRSISRGHESILEHATVSLRFICDRGVTHELVRHRIASYSQESTRYCNYSNGKFGEEITVIKPCFWEDGSNQMYEWEEAMWDAERHYMELLKLGATPQEARSVLPNSLKTEIVVTMNLREWRHFIRLRYLGVAGSPHPQIKEVAKMAYDLLMEQYPAFFEDLKKD